MVEQMRSEKHIKDHRAQPNVNIVEDSPTKMPLHITKTIMPTQWHRNKLGTVPSSSRFIAFAALYLFISLLGLGLGLSLSAEASPNDSNVSAMYLLGDSSVDCGINTLFYPILRRNFSLLPCNGDDASLLPHFLAEKMGLPYSQPLYRQNGSIEAIIDGLNFGSAQATIMSGRSYQSLNQQLRQVLDTIQLLRLRLGQDAARHFINSSIFYISFGQIDFINQFLQNSSGAMQKLNGREFARLLVSQMTIALRNLYNTEARKIICMGILPLGCSPRVLAAAKYEEKGCVREMNELILKYNKLMKKQIVKLSAQLDGAQMVFCDGYKGVMEIINNPRRYGFEETRSACCGIGSYNASIGCMTMDIACREVSRYVWWDLYNLTPVVNSLLAESAWRNKPFSSFCHPFTVQHLVATASVTVPLSHS